MKSNRLQQLMAFLEATPNEPFILFAIAKEYEKHHDTANALKFYLKIEKDHPKYVGLYYHLGKLYEQLEEYQMAFDTYLAGMKVAKREGDAHSLGELAQAKMIVEEDFLED